MSVFSDLRVQLAADLEVLGVPSFAAWPTSIAGLPCVFVLPPLGASYVTAGPNFSQYTVLTDVVIVAEHDDAGTSLDALETLLAGAIRNSADWNFIGVDTPAPLTVIESGAEYLGTVLHLSKPVIL